MKVTILEYEEEPSSPSGSSSSLLRERPVREYNLQMMSSSNDGNTKPTKLTVSCRDCKQNHGDILRSPLNVMKKLFLPLGYPNSVSDTYLPYQLYDGLQGLCSYWRGVVSAKAVFEAAGVGNSEATALSAALSWALRDGTGMIGGLVYSYVASSYFDSHAKEFRLLLADVINDIALTLDMIAPYFGPEASIWVLGLSTIGKTICGITAGATKGHITQHFATDGGNVADLTAKESTQETLVSLLGMMGGVWVAKILDKHGQNDPFFWTWLLFGILTAIHVWANYKAVTLLKLTTLNPERTRELFRKSIDVMANQVQGRQKANVASPGLLGSIRSLESPKLVQESLLSSTWCLLFPKICVSSSLNLNRLQDCSIFRFDLKDVDDGNGSNRLPYVIGYDVSNVVYIWLKVGATIQNELQAYVHALLLQKVLSDNPEKAKNSNNEWNVSLLQRTHLQVLHLFGNYPVNDNLLGKRICDRSSQKPTVSLMERLDLLGWDIRSRLYLGFSSRRLQTSLKDD
mmetsp:Transcript_4974/g.11051  ORF Transcript_4974/g.11051 Transcript_4974/m.11051 type:complete len:515 (-) Transcript_4974:2563-4107(-)